MTGSMPSEQGPSGSAQSQGERTRTRLLREATEILAAEGVAALTVRRVTQAAGCSTIGVYTHFGGKEGLVEAALLDAYADFEAAVAETDVLPPGQGQLLASANAYRAWAIANPSRYLMMFARQNPGWTPSEEALARMDISFQSHTRRVREAATTGEVAGEPELVAHHLWATVHGHVMVEIVLRDYVPAEERRHTFDASMRLLLSGISRVSG